MKTENFNLHIYTLDDQTLYREIGRKIKESNTIGLKLLGLVPLVSGVCVVVLWSQSPYLPGVVMVLVGMFGALVTYFIFRWGKRNRQIYNVFKQYACILEAKKSEQEQEQENELPGEKFNGPYSLLAEEGKPTLIKDRKGAKGWGKTEAESAIYTSTIILWLIMPLSKLL